MKSRIVIFFILSASLLAACSPSVSNQPVGTEILPATASISLPPATSQPYVPPPSTVVDTPPARPLTANQVVLARAGEVVQALQSQDMALVSAYVHPVQGVRFSPYAYVKDTDLVFSPAQAADLPADSSIYSWGNYAGTGEPIILGFPDYYAKFIYDVDYANAPQVSLNHRLSGGNSIDNAAEFYPGSMIVEYYFPGFDPQYGGMDWRSLKLVFSQADGSWDLVGIIHDEWTP